MLRASTRTLPATIRAAAIAVAIAMLAAAAPLDATAQTLTDPSGPKRPPAPANKPATARMKSCSQYGPGFIYMPATDTCIKIGGYVEGGMGAGG
jgi:uncharacterized membrane protein YdfJ with MMPL/SSD domain